MQRDFGITLDDYYAICDEQYEQCDICGVSWTETKERRLVIDHDHETEQVRGLLCSGCNAGLGFFTDDPKRLEAAIRYLRDGGSQAVHDILHDPDDDFWRITCRWCQESEA